ncbi:hypothetical protein GCM10009098_20480 [Rheinheimera aquimaris]|uniref:Uncharacterized protein n=1 Tax=Rheinheimera aquimaris TaxID=412437 RepID=A0ABN1DVF8_9GAMM|nr:hypothetical protein [Rheinheimera aquimaris]MCB5214049.1 hypothetical protein [Rheinheimera aquimaris]
MTLLPGIFVVVLLICVVWCVTRVIRSPLIKLNDEDGLKPIFEEICGGRFNMINYTWPLVRHSVYESIVVIKFFGGSYVMPRNSLFVENANGIFSSGIRYKSPKYRFREIRIWTSEGEKVISELGKNA